MISASCYACAGNDPINSIDPAGRCDSGDAAKSAGAQIGLRGLSEGGIVGAGAAASGGPVTLGLGALVGVSGGAGFAYCALDRQEASPHGRRI